MKNKKKLMSSIACISIFVVILASCTQKPKDITEQIKQANNDFMMAVSQSDTTVLSALYTNDAKLFPSNNDIIEGKVAITGFWSATLKMGIKKVLFETEIAQQFGDIAIEEGKFKLFVDGDQMVDQGKYIVTWKNEAGKWKVYRDIWNSSTPPAQARASKNDNVLIVLHNVKADRVDQFEDFYKNYLAVSGAEYNPQVKNTVRLQKSIEQNSDGTYTYVFLMDPFVKSYNYDIKFSLSAKYGEKKAEEYVNMYLDCLKERKAQSILTVETGW